jgi:hypothetical protein
MGQRQTQLDAFADSIRSPRKKPPKRRNLLHLLFGRNDRGLLRYPWARSFVQIKSGVWCFEDPRCLQSSDD